MDNCQFTQHGFELQNTDDGFFEKFGSLLLQTSADAFKEPSISATGENGAQWFPPLSVTEELDSVKADEKLFEKYTGINVDKLYEEVLFLISRDPKICGDTITEAVLVQFLRDAFKISDDLHTTIAAIISQKDSPQLRLNIEIIKAEDLLPKDANGLSDPFATVYLTSKNTHRYNSSVKRGNLNPVWEEHFSLPMNYDVEDDMLVIEIWDYDAVETVSERLNKVLDVKGIKGIRKLLKEVAIAMSSGKHGNEIIGSTTIRLSSIPPTGSRCWYNLEKSGQSKFCGSVLVNAAMGSEKNRHVAIYEHMQLLLIFLMHELETFRASEYSWNDNFCKESETILLLHMRQSGLTTFDCALCQWYSYSIIHEVHKLSFTLFNSILTVILPNLKSVHYDYSYMKTLWIGARKILPSCFGLLRNMRTKNISEKILLYNLGQALDIFLKLGSLEIPVEIEIFPKDIYIWLPEGTEMTIFTIALEAIKLGSRSWIQKVSDEIKESNFQEQTEESKLRYYIKLVQIARADLQRAIELFDHLFFCKTGLHLSSELYEVYDNEIYELIQPTVQEMCIRMKELDFQAIELHNSTDITNFTKGATLFELYLSLKHFVALGTHMHSINNLKLGNFYEWFEGGVAHWLDLSTYKALNRIQKAINIDQISGLDDRVKYSSSAVDTMAVFYQIQIFWKQLEWPNNDGAYTFLVKILNDICRCGSYYAQLMYQRINEIWNSKWELPNAIIKWCVAVNNIEHILQSLPSLIKEYETNNILDKIRVNVGCPEADRCSSTVSTLIDNSLETLQCQISELIELLAFRMSPVIQHMMTQGAEMNPSSYEQLLSYLDTALKILYESLNYTNFIESLDSVWNIVCISVSDVIRIGIEGNKSPAFFQSLEHFLQTMVQAFEIPNSSNMKFPRLLNEIERVLQLHSCETSKLIHKYYLENLSSRDLSEKLSYGELSLIARFSGNDLFIRILNLRNIKPANKSRHCDAFVVGHLLPAHVFKTTPPIKTSVQNKTCCPLYDETFKLSFTEEVHISTDNIIVFVVKNKDVFGITNQYLSECCISIADLKNRENEQLLLTLSRPQDTGSDIIKAIQSRQDKEARNFLKKFNAK